MAEIGSSPRSTELAELPAGGLSLQSGDYAGIPPLSDGGNTSLQRTVLVSEQASVQASPAVPVDQIEYRMTKYCMSLEW